MDFHHPPVACRVRGFHVYIEGESSGLEDEDMMDEAVARFGHHLGRDPITVYQWLHAIHASDDVDSVRDCELMEGMSRVMLGSRFPTASHPNRDERIVAALQEIARLGASAHIEFDEPQSPDGAAMAALLDVPDGHALVIEDSSSLLGRIQSLLSASPVGPQAFTKEQGEDEEAQFTLISLLLKNHGYTSMVAQRSPGQKWGDRLQPPSTVNLFNALGSETAVGEFFQTLVRSGWDGTGSVYMSRKAPAFNPLAAIRPFESLVHHKIIGWRLPQELVDRQTLAARAVLERENPASTQRLRRSMSEA